MGLNSNLRMKIHLFRKHTRTCLSYGMADANNVLSPPANKQSHSKTLHANLLCHRCILHMLEWFMCLERMEKHIYILLLVLDIVWNYIKYFSFNLEIKATIYICKWVKITENFRQTWKFHWNKPVERILAWVSRPSSGMSGKDSMSVSSSLSRFFSSSVMATVSLALAASCLIHTSIKSSSGTWRKLKISK